MAGDRVSRQIRRHATSVASGVQVASGLYMTGPGARQSTAKGPNALELAPFENSVEQWIAGVAINVTGAGANVRIGIYADDGAARPGSLFLDLGTVSAGTTGVKTITQGFTLPVGLWWIGSAAQGGSVTLSCYSGAMRPVSDADFGNVAGQGANGYQNFSVPGALPAIFGTPAGVATSTPVVGLLTA